MNKHIIDLTEEEKQYFKDLFQGRYTVLEQIGKAGVRTVAYLLEDEEGNKYALKKSKGADDGSWLRNQLKADEKRKEYTKGYKGNISIGNIVEYGDSWIVEPYQGEDFTLDVYNSLSSEQQNEFAKGLAELLNNAHQNSCDKDKSKVDLNMFANPDFKEILDYLSPILNEEETEKLHTLVKEFKETDFKDLSVLTHDDIRGQNLLYDKEANRLSIIDFELVKTGNIYRDFVPAAAASCEIDYNFLSKVVYYYNHSEKEHNIQISPKKVALLHEVGCLHEYGRCAIWDKLSGESLAFSKRRIFEDIDNIEKGFNKKDVKKAYVQKTPKLGM